jgi:hypothetical protein
MYSDVLGYEPFRMRVAGVPIFGIHAYGSLFAMNVSKSTKPYIIQARRVYAFKKFGKHLKEYVELIGRLQKASGADLIVAIPSSKTSKISTLQGAFGDGLKRSIDSESRKYNHSGMVEDKGKVVLQVDVAGKKVLLIDDVVTTGKSILFYRQMLLDAGAADIISAGVGVSFAACVYRPDSQVVDDVFDKIRGSQVLEPEQEVEYEDVPVSSLEAMLMQGADSLQTELGETQWVGISGPVAVKIKEVARQLKVSESEVVRLAVEAFGEE